MSSGAIHRLPQPQNLPWHCSRLTAAHRPVGPHSCLVTAAMLASRGVPKSGSSLWCPQGTRPMPLLGPQADSVSKPSLQVVVSPHLATGPARCSRASLRYRASHSPRRSPGPARWQTRHTPPYCRGSCNGGWSGRPHPRSPRRLARCEDVTALDRPLALLADKHAGIFLAVLDLAVADGRVAPIK